jgi:hypothetical protein
MKEGKEYEELSERDGDLLLKFPLVLEAARRNS